MPETTTKPGKSVVVGANMVKYMEVGTAADTLGTRRTSFAAAKPLLSNKKIRRPSRQPHL
jgi:hypothetical protein